MTAATNFELILDRHSSSAERVARWTDVMGVSGRVHVPDAGDFTGTLISRSFGELRTMRISATTFKLERDRVMAKTMRRDYVFINLVESGSISGLSSLKKVRLEAGDLMISRMASPIDLLIENATWLALIIPKALLERHMRWQSSLDARIFGSGTIEAVMLGGLLRSVTALPHTLPPRQAASAARSSLALLSACLGSTPPAASISDETDPARLIRQYIAERLSDPNLGPELICREFEISRARLYRLMGGGADIASLVRRMRLHAIRRDIASNDPLGVTLAAIGQRWGLTDERTFRRAFTKEFGHSPSVFRKQVRAGAASPIQDTRTIGTDLQRWFLDL